MQANINRFLAIVKADIKFRREDYQGTHKLCDDCQTFPSSTKEMHELNSREAKLNMGNDIFLSHERMQYYTTSLGKLQAR